MKLKVVASVLLLLIFGILLGRIYLPVWLWTSLLAFFVVLFVVYLVCTYEKERELLGKRFTDLEELICKISCELKTNSELNKNEILSSVASGLDSVSKLADDGFAAQSQRDDSLQQSFEVGCSALKAGIDSGIAALQNTMVVSLDKSDTVILGQIRTAADEIKQSVVTGTEILKSDFKASSDNFIRQSLEYNDALHHSLEGLSVQTTQAYNAIEQKTSELVAKSDSIAMTMIQSSELVGDMKIQMDTTKNEILSSVAISLDKSDTVILGQIRTAADEIKQSVVTGTEILKSDFKASSDNLIRQSQEYNDALHHSLEGLSVQTSQAYNAIEQKTSELVAKSDSIALTLDESILKKDVLCNGNVDELSINVMSAINVLSGEVAENKNLLQMVIRTLSKESKSPNVSVERDEHVSKQVVSATEPCLNPNRTEEFLDAETGNLVSNQYKDDRLFKSVMKQKGRVVYEVEYKNDTIYKTRNYDAKGNLNIEQVFYENGQVHYRNEYTKGGKKMTEFDKNGNRR